MPSRGVIGLATVFLWAFFALPAVAAPVPGDLVKLSGDTAVYYVGTDGKRYVFPNAATYATWYADFSAVKTVSASELAALPIGGTIAYRAGTRMVKIVSDPTVYIVEPGGALRPVPSESVARSLYGANWARRVDDLSDAFFFAYEVREPFESGTFPSGTIARRSSDGVLFFIDGLQKRRITSDTARTTLRVQDAFVLTVSATSLEKYVDGPNITGIEPSYIDTAQRTARPDAPVSLRLVPPVGNAIPFPGDATLATLRISSGRAVTVRRLTVRLTALKNDPLSRGIADIDDDAGGIVYGDAESLNLSELRFAYADGRDATTRRSPVLDTTLDQAQEFTFTDAIFVPAGGSVAVRLMARMGRLLPVGETYTVTIVAAQTEFADVESGVSVPVLPTTDLVTPTLTTVRGGLEVTAAPVPGGTTVVRGASQASIAAFALRAPAGSDAVLTRLTVVGYINEGEGGNRDFRAGEDTDNTTPTTVNQMVREVSLYDGAGTRLAGPVPVAFNGRAEFSGLAFRVAAGQSGTVVVRGDMDGSVDFEERPNGLTFDVADAETDAAAVDAEGAALPVIGKLPNGGERPRYSVTVYEQGRLTFSWEGEEDGVVLVGTDADLGELTVAAEYDSFRLTSMSFRLQDGLAAPLPSARLTYTTSSGQSAEAVAAFTGSVVWFTGLDIVVIPGSPRTFRLFASVPLPGGGIVTGDRLSVLFEPAGPMAFSSITTGDTFGPTDAPSGIFRVGTNEVSDVVVRFTTLTLRVGSGSPSGIIPRSDAAEVLRFTATAGPTGNARILQMAFLLRPGDAGYVYEFGYEEQYEAEDNDALERWAAKSDGFLDDDDIANLYMWEGVNPTLIGEGRDGRTIFTIGGDTDLSAYTVSRPNQTATLTYEFPLSQALVIPAGATRTFSFEVDTTGFANWNEWPFGVELLGAEAFVWTDVADGAPSLLDGRDAPALPLRRSVRVAR